MSFETINLGEGCTQRIYSDGVTKWYRDGEYPREDGPAVEVSDRYKAWYLNGKSH